MSKKKLLSAGCSLIYGAELSDSLDYHGRSNASLKTWPALLADHFNYDYFTCSLCGVSNQGIVRHVIDVCERYEFDLLIVQWTFFARYELRFNKKHDHFNEPSHYSNLSPWMCKYFDVPKNWSKEKNQELHEVFNNLPSGVKKGVDFWFDEIDCYDTAIYNYLKCTTELATYLKWKNIPFVFACAETEPTQQEIASWNDTSIDSLYKIHKSMPFVNFNDKGFYHWALEEKFPFGIDHPKDQAHAAGFNLILDQINNLL